MPPKYTSASSRPVKKQPEHQLFTPSLEQQRIIDAIKAGQNVAVNAVAGSGKTTTLYGALQYINRPDINILTAEDPVEYYLEGAGQVQANEIGRAHV